MRKGDERQVPKPQLQRWKMAPTALFAKLMGIQSEVNISSYPATRVAGLFFHSRAVIFKSGCFVQKYWSGAVTRNAVMRRAADY